MASRNARDDRDEDVADYGRRLNEHSSGDNMCLILPEGIKLFAPKNDGPYKLDVLAHRVGDGIGKFLNSYAKPGQLYPERTYWMHRDIGPNNVKVVCLARTFGEECPICEARQKLRNISKPTVDQEEEEKALRPKERQVWLVLDVENESAGVQLWEESFHNFGLNLDTKIKNSDPKKREQYKRYFHPRDGCTLRLVANWKTLGRTKFLEFYVDEFIPRREGDLDQRFIDKALAIDLEACIRRTPYEEVAKLFHGGGEQAEAREERGGRGRGEESDRDRASRMSREAADTGRSRGRDEAPPAREEAPRGRGRAEEPPAREERGRRDDPPAREEKKPPADIRKGDRVVWSYRGETLRGEVTEVLPEKDIAYVQCPGEARERSADLDALELDDDKAPPPREEPPARGGREEAPRGRGRDDEAPRGRGREEAPAAREEAPRGRGRGSEEPAPAPRGGGGRDSWDDDDGKGFRDNGDGRGRGRDDKPAEEPRGRGRGRGQ